MADKFPLQTLLDLSNLRLDEAAKKLGALVANERAAAERLQVLTDYRGEYNERFLAAARNGLLPKEWQNYRHFIDRLDEAINQARELLEQSQRQTQLGQTHWLEKRGKVKAFDTLAQRHAERQVYIGLKIEQKLSDEHAARGFRHSEDHESDDSGGHR